MLLVAACFKETDSHEYQWEIVDELHILGGGGFRRGIIEAWEWRHNNTQH